MLLRAFTIYPHLILNSIMQHHILINKGSFTLSKPAQEALFKYSFPGNIRELINIMKRVVVFATSNEISELDVFRALDWSPFNIGNERVPGLGGVAALGSQLSLAELEQKHIEMLMEKYDNVSEVAKILKVDRRTLQRKIQSWS